ncbi:hypothetical protein BTUL_0198g00050 [Botrytis tulipae]|uniref:Uncharacterized protein n=1 Tax=Botrytis tulipae TaxID=87230 RepID=A0A4Z1E8W3_9HELO|nr:hypothetical protein BTUL_0198g00050 [Botrytis tulipae]
MKIEPAGHNRAENSRLPATLDERDDPNSSVSELSLLGIVLGDITSAIGAQRARSPSAETLDIIV